MNENLKAFLDTIATSELGARLLAETDNGYNVLVGATPAHPLVLPTGDDGAPDYSAHPNILNHALNSTAAGRYQFIHSTWLDLARKLNLPDFSPASQDEACIELITECHALDSAVAGRFDEACGACAHIWASLPGAGYGQHENALDALRADFVADGGTVADA